MKAAISPTRSSEGQSRVLVELEEWSAVSASSDRRLGEISFRGDSRAQRAIESLAPRILIQEGYDGLRITSTSHVGRIDIGPLRIAVYPKLAQLPLTRLFRYAYGLRDLHTVDETLTPTTKHGLHDLIVAMLCAEVGELLHRGLSRKYVSLEAPLSSPRGKILMGDFVRRGGTVSATIPCRFFERRTDWFLNRVLLSGLELACGVASDSALKRRARQLTGLFAEVEPLARIGLDEVRAAQTALTRLTEANRPALTLIELLMSSLGASMETAAPSTLTPGFLFDMNLFFQSLVSRFLREGLPNAAIRDQNAIKNVYAYAPDGNPHGRQNPKPRPDFALFKDGQLSFFLDAKYRDVWQRGFTADWLYQLSVYALACPARTSVLLYASMSPQARDERLHIRQPIVGSNVPNALLIIRPVPLLAIAEMLGIGARDLQERRAMAERLIAT